MTGLSPRPARQPLATFGVNAARIAFIVAHAPIALLAHGSRGLATVHAMGTAGYALWQALTARSPESALYAAAYIAGAELLWRMSKASVPWEFGKYAMALVLIIAGLRLRSRRSAFRAVLYFALLVPSAALTLTYLPIETARRAISFNLSGPLAITVTVWFVSRTRAGAIDLERLFLALLAPVVGVAFLAGVATFGGGGIVEFDARSNVVTSGGFGPNQVSAMLGLGAFLAFFYVIDESPRRLMRLVMLGLVGLLAIQSAMTFSRSGFYSALASALVAGLFLAGRKRARIRVLLVGAGLAMIAAVFVVPRLDAFTGGALSERFTNTDPTHRDQIARGDLQLWQQHPVVGVGPGRGRYERRTGKVAAAHTEYTRLLAEHGLFGLVAMILMLSMPWRNFRHAASARDRALIASFATWSAIFMVHSATRLAAPMLMFGLAAALTSARPKRGAQKGAPAPSETPVVAPGRVAA